MFVSFECLRNLLDKGYLFAYTRKLNLKVYLYLLSGGILRIGRARLFTSPSEDT